MNEVTKIKKKTLENNLAKLLEILKENIEPYEAIKIYENLIAVIKADIEEIDHSKQVCSSCGISLKDWEKDICGPCKIKDGRYLEEPED